MGLENYEITPAKKGVEVFDTSVSKYPTDSFQSEGYIWMPVVKVSCPDQWEQVQIPLTYIDENGKQVENQLYMQLKDTSGDHIGENEELVWLFNPAESDEPIYNDKVSKVFEYGFYSVWSKVQQASNDTNTELNLKKSIKLEEDENLMLFQKVQTAIDSDNVFFKIPHGKRLVTG